MNGFLCMCAGPDVNESNRMRKDLIDRRFECAAACESSSFRVCDFHNTQSIRFLGCRKILTNVVSDTDSFLVLLIEFLSELGGDVLFPRRLGFSGTPSNLLPQEFGECQYVVFGDVVS